MDDPNFLASLKQEFEKEGYDLGYLLRMAGGEPPFTQLIISTCMSFCKALEVLTEEEGAGEIHFVADEVRRTAVDKADQSKRWEDLSIPLQLFYFQNKEGDLQFIEDLVITHESLRPLYQYCRGIQNDASIQNRMGPLPTLSPAQELKELNDYRKKIHMYHMIYSMKQPEDPTYDSFNPDESFHPFIHALGLQHANYKRSELEAMLAHIDQNAQS